MDPAKLDALRRILEAAATARVRSSDLLEDAAELIVDSGDPEHWRATESVLTHWLNEWGPGDTADGLSDADVTAVLELIKGEIEDQREVVERQRIEEQENAF